MGHFYFLLGLAGLLLLTFGLHLHRRFGRRGRLPFVVDQALFTPPQRAFLAVLERALGADFRVYGRVRVAEVIALRPRLDRAARRRAWALLGDRQFDFLVCAAATGAIVGAVNLAPRSRRGRPPPRDALDRICAAAGLPFVRVREADDYAAAGLTERLVQAMQTQVRPVPAPPVPVQVLRAPPRPEAAPDLYTLSEVVVEDAREPRLRSVAARPRAPTPTAVRVAAVAVVPVVPVAPAAPAAPVVLPTTQSPRREPTLAGPGDLDPGPAFQVNGGLEEEDDQDGRPVRAWRR
ncbi:DUF2726 domain-containing protein [uncultured Thiodictyon sp.]|uniref:DUF2726 domain-containing protein n=1 Tax=uncultured Thiodictyon sp. TaxID=1846217 RepID=UPI0025FB7B32|nr:DUF2726 domain-containing protein [uncultured Thiodictyon sp.]